MSYRSEQTYAGPNHTTQITYEEAVGDNDDVKNNNATATTTTTNNDKDKTTTKTNKLGTKIIKFQFSSSAGAEVVYFIHIGMNVVGRKNV